MTAWVNGLSGGRYSGMTDAAIPMISPTTTATVRL